MRWRWHEDSVPGTPWGNMATDQALFDEVSADDAALPIVRAYRWDRPSVSMGRLQDEDAVRRQYPGLTAVRRPTGGRAVVHGDDLTLTLAARERGLPSEGRGGVMPSYRLIVGGLVCAFQAVGVEAALGSGAGQPGAVNCFDLAARCDVISRATGQKLVGCAQRRQGRRRLAADECPAGRPARRAERVFGGGEGGAGGGAGRR